MDATQVRNNPATSGTAEAPDRSCQAKQSKNAAAVTPTSAGRLRALIIEDFQPHAELEILVLRRAGFEVSAEVVDAREAFLEKVRAQPWDVVLADYQLPRWSGLEAPELLKKEGLEIPVILVTETGGEQVAAECIKCGVADYVFKERLARLPSAVQTAMRGAAENRRRREADNALRWSEARLAAIITSAMDAIVTVNEEQRVTLFNPAAEKMFGISSEQALGAPLDRFIPERFRSAYREFMRDFGRTGIASRKVARKGTVIGLRADGTEFPVEVSISRISTHGHELCTAIIRDVTERKRIEDALRESEARYRQLFEAAQNGILLVDSKTEYVISANPAAVEILDGKEDDVLGRRLWEIPAFQRTGATQETFRSLSGPDLTIQQASGLLMDIEFLTSPCRVSDRDLVQCSLRDVTFRRKAELEAKALAELLEENVAERTQQLRALNDELMVEVAERRAAEASLSAIQQQTELILNSAAEAIFRVGPDGTCVFANPAASRVLGFNREEMLGQNLHALCGHRRTDGSECAREDCELQLALRLGKAQSAINQIFTRKDGVSIWVDTVTSPIAQAGRITGAVQVCRDVSERHAIERMKDEFVSMVSHELRTPLTAIRGALWLLAADKSSTVSDRLRRMLEIALTNTDRLTRLINEVLDCARWESTQAQVAGKPCSSVDLADQAVGLMRPLAETAGVILETAVERCALFVDPDAILQALTNLLSNAIKYSPPGSKVQFECCREGENGVFRVLDHGPGIPSDKLESIFGRFQPVDASDTRRKGGSGLGLYLCRMIVQRHGGRVWAESELGQGSTFIVMLPLEPSNC